MSEQIPGYTRLFVCPRCVTPAGEPGPCTNCGAERVECAPGDAHDPCRKPLMTGSGQVKTRAPLWWLRFKNRWLTEAAERYARTQ